MEKNNKKGIIEALTDIESKLDDIITLMRLSKKSDINKLKDKLLASKVRKMVYNLCDSHSSVSEMAKKLNKPISNVSRALQELESEGLVKSRKSDKKTIYEQVV